MQSHLKGFAAIAWLALSGAVLNARAETEQKLTLVTEDYPPYNFIDQYDKQPTGVSVEKVREIMQRAGIAYDLKVYPWKRALNIAFNNQNACAFSTARTKPRESEFRWIGPLVAGYSWSIFARADDRRHVTKLNDLRPYVMGSYTLGEAGEFLTAQGFRTDLADTDNVNPSKLLHKRFDYWAAGTAHAQDLIQKQGLTDQIVPKFKFFSGALYLACNRNFPQQKLDKLRRILRDMNRDGTARAIENKYQ